MNRIIVLLSVLLGVSLPLAAQHPNVVVGNPIGWGFPSEPSVCMNPAATNEIMVGAMGDNFYTSTDGGFNWTHGTLQSTWGVNADPVILCDASGRFYYLHLPYVIERVVVHRCNNISAPWSMERSVAYNGAFDVDKEWAAYDPVNDRIYLSWTYFDTWGSSNPLDSSCIYLSWSSDGGESWADSVRISDKKGNATGGVYSSHGSYPATGPGGEVYVAWFGPDGLMFDRSLDLGLTWLPQDINVTQGHVNWIYSIPGIYLGVTFPSIACDRSGGPCHGNIYICWADKRNGGNNTDVFIARSTDGGLTWSSPIRVNDDPPGRHQFFPFITVDQVTGKVWIAFYDRRNYTDSNTDVWMAVSEDGGESFINFKVSESPFIPFSTVFIGHYIGVTAHEDRVFPVWARMDTGVVTLMGAMVNVEAVGVKNPEEVPFATLENSPNPFDESSFISFRLRSPADVTLQLFDLAGSLVTTLVDRAAYSAGKHVGKVDARQLGLRPGAYLVVLTAGGKQVTRKIVCVGQ